MKTKYNKFNYLDNIIFFWPTWRTGTAKNNSSWAVTQSCKKGVRNFGKFARKHQYQSLFLNNVAALSAGTLLEERLWYRCFPVKFAEFLGTSYLTEHLWWLLLTVAVSICAWTLYFLLNIFSFFPTHWSLFSKTW